MILLSVLPGFSQGRVVVWKCFLYCNICRICVCTHSAWELTIAGHQGSVGRFTQCSTHEAKTGASMKHVEVDWPASPQNFSYSGHHICQEDESTRWIGPRAMKTVKSPPAEDTGTNQIRQAVYLHLYWSTHWMFDAPRAVGKWIQSKVNGHHSGSGNSK